MAEIHGYRFNHPAGYIAVYTEETVEKLNARRAGRPLIRFNIAQKTKRKGQPVGPVVIANVTPTELQFFQGMANEQGSTIEVSYYQPPGCTDTQSEEVSIQSLRARTGLNQKEFGDFLYGIPYRSIQNWEGGQKNCPDYLVKLIEYRLKKENLIEGDTCPENGESAGK